MSESQTLVTTDSSTAHMIFTLAQSEYAVSVSQVREIITSITISPVPGSPDYLTGVTNLRGHILPIVDLRRRFEIEGEFDSERECIVVLSIENEESTLEFGIRADAVVEVVSISEEEIDPAPTMNDFSGKLVFSGIARSETGVKLVLDTQTLVKQLKHDIDTASRNSSEL